MFRILSVLLNSVVVPFVLILSFCLILAYSSGGRQNIQLISESIGIELPYNPICFDERACASVVSEEAYLANSQIAQSIEQKLWPAFGSYSDHYEGPGTFWYREPDVCLSTIFGQHLPRGLFEREIADDELRCPFLHSLLPYPIQFVFPCLTMAISSLAAKNLSRSEVLLSVLTAACFYCLVMVYPVSIPVNLVIDKVINIGWGWFRPVCNLCFTVVLAISTKRILGR